MHLVLLTCEISILLLDRNLTPWNKSPCWEASSYSHCLEISRNFWKPKVHSRVHKSQRLFPNLSQMNRVHIHLLFQIHSNELHSTLRSSKWSVSFTFSSRDIVCTFFPAWLAFLFYPYPNMKQHIFFKVIHPHFAVKQIYVFPINLHSRTQHHTWCSQLVPGLNFSRSCGV